MKRTFTKLSRRLNKNSQGGFSLAELVVVVAIFIMITSAILIRQNTFSSDISLTNLAYQIGLSIRQAQVYGLSVRGTQIDSSNTSFNAAYGINFNAANKTTYIFYGDLDTDGLYVAENDKAISNNILAKGDTIQNACIVGSKEPLTCFTGYSGVGGNLAQQISGGLDSIDITFKRPNPDAIINGTSLTNGPTSGATRAYISVQSANKTKIKCINIYATGQISVIDPVQTDYWGVICQ